LTVQLNGKNYFSWEFEFQINIKRKNHHLFDVVRTPLLLVVQYFLGLEVHTSTKGLFVNQHKYTKEHHIYLGRLKNSSPVDTPLELNVKYHRDDGELIFNPTFYRKLSGCLFYLTITHPNILMQLTS